MVLLTTNSFGYNLGYLFGIVLSLFLFMLLISSIYYLIKRFVMRQSYLSYWQIIFSKWVTTSSIALTVLGLIGRAMNQNQ